MLVKTTDEQTLLHVLTASCAPALKYVVVLASKHTTQGSIWQNNIWLLLKAPT